MWWILLLLLLVGWEAYSYLIERRPSYKIKQLKKKIDRLYPLVVENAEKAINEQGKILKQMKDEEAKKLFQDNLEDVWKHKGHIEEMEGNFIRLIERYKHQSTKYLLEIYQDWLDYLQTQVEMSYLVGLFQYISDEKEYDECLKKGQKYHIQADEIEKRFNDKLSSKLPILGK